MSFLFRRFNSKSASILNLFKQQASQHKTINIIYAKYTTTTIKSKEPSPSFKDESQQSKYKITKMSFSSRTGGGGGPSMSQVSSTIIGPSPLQQIPSPEAFKTDDTSSTTPSPPKVIYVKADALKY